MNNERVCDEQDVRILLKRGLKELKDNELTFAYRDMDAHLNIKEGSTARLIESVVSDIPSLKIDDMGPNLITLQRISTGSRLVRG